ncbi:phosphogluconate dehydratase [Skermanella pratensis]|uniref:phosphogluconate dehydratase n=1 Tax=Skermanella pratensis TaxID=2233999 RepID=UPI001300ED98|nr:phosphogluconate dehydratase [Skermanella pratensis]
MELNQTIARVTDRLIERSADQRSAYLARIRAAADKGPTRSRLSCSNLAHGFAACAPSEKQDLAETAKPDIAIVSAYNDMLSAHQPLETFPAIIKRAVHENGGVAQFAGGVPAMCDGVTQGNAGMELSLFSRDVIAMATAVALSHDMFDGALMLGVCDKIVPGLVIGALSFGHLPTIMVPAGPMTSGLPNAEKSRIRQLYAEGKVGRDALLDAESKSYHGPGTCTFYGTANSNQMLMEIMGLHLPGAAFINPGTPLRDALTAAAGKRVLEITALGNQYTPAGEVVDERAVVNGVIGLLATGGSTNHTIHLIAMAHAAGISLSWQDFADLSGVVPMLAKVYPNGNADVNHFHAAGGMAFVIRELLDAGLLHEEVRTVAGDGGMRRYAEEPVFEGEKLAWRPGTAVSLDAKVLGTVEAPFAKDGGIKVLDGNFGRAVIKTSAVKREHRFVEAPARVFTGQAELQAAFKRGELHRDFVAVVTFQGPKANGMPELHKLTPPLGVLQDLGFKVALVTDGRMSGASGKVPAAIHVTPEAASGGMIARIRDGDMVRLDAENGTLEILLDAEEFAAREPASPDLTGNRFGTGRDLFGAFRALVGGAEDGASVFTTAA